MYKKGIYKILANEPLTATVWRMVLGGGIRSGSPPRAVRRHRPRRPLPAPSDLGLRLRRHDAHAHLQGGGRGNRTDEPYGRGRGARPADGARQRVRRAQCRTASLLVGGGVVCPRSTTWPKCCLRQANGSVWCSGSIRRTRFSMPTNSGRWAATSIWLRPTVRRVSGGFVTTAIAECRPEFDYFYACGPLPMLRALCDAVQQDGQLSFEERMGCGFGACMGCSCKTKYGNKRICKEGPVLTKGEVIW